MLEIEKTPLVSIALATYNGEKFLCDQLDSLLKQTYRNVEIVISDDNSTDKTISIVDEYINKDNRIILLKNSENIGFKKNFEKAILACKGEIIFLCDQDDIWHENKIKSHMDIYIDKSIKWIYNEVRLIDSTGNKIGLLTDSSSNYYNNNIKLLHRTGGRCILGCATSYRTECIKNIWPISEFAPSHDSYIQLCVSDKKFFYLKRILQDYRQHDNNVFGVNKKNDNVNIKKNVTRSIMYVKDLCKNNKFTVYKRVTLLIILCGKIINHNTKNTFRFLDK